MMVLGKKYKALAEKFPLVLIQSKADLKKAYAVLMPLVKRGDDLEEEEQAYVDVLSVLISKFEEDTKMYPVEKSSPAEMLEFLMTENNLSQSDLARELGIRQNRISEIVSGNREFSKNHVAMLAQYFKVSPALFLPAIDLPATTNSKK